MADDPEEVEGAPKKTTANVPFGDLDTKDSKFENVSNSYDNFTDMKQDLKFKDAFNSYNNSINIKPSILHNSEHVKLSHIRANRLEFMCLDLPLQLKDNSGSSACPKWASNNFINVRHLVKSFKELYRESVVILNYEELIARDKPFSIGLSCGTAIGRGDFVLRGDGKYDPYEVLCKITETRYIAMYVMRSDFIRNGYVIQLNAPYFSVIELKNEKSTNIEKITIYKPEFFDHIGYLVKVNMQNAPHNAVQIEITKGSDCTPLLRCNGLDNASNSAITYKLSSNYYKDYNVSRILYFIHTYTETLDKYVDTFCIQQHIDKVLMMLMRCKMYGD